jgi:hypothetical protein
LREGVIAIEFFAWVLSGQKMFDRKRELRNLLLRE